MLAWRFGYGNRFDEVFVEISGYGPTDTVYVTPADTPKP